MEKDTKEDFPEAKKDKVLRFVDAFILQLGAARHACDNARGRFTFGGEKSLRELHEEFEERRMTLPHPYDGYLRQDGERLQKELVGSQTQQGKRKAFAQIFQEWSEKLWTAEFFAVDLESTLRETKPEDRLAVLDRESQRNFEVRNGVLEFLRNMRQ